MNLPTVTLPQGEVTLRPLGFDDLETLTRIIEIGMAGRVLTPQGLLVAIALGLPRALKECMPWFASLLGMTPEEFRDPVRVPFHALPSIFRAVAAHPDLTNFRDSLLQAMASDAITRFKQRTEANHG